MLGCALIVAVVLSPVLRARFTTWDDAQTVAQNPWLRAPAAESVPHFWARPHMDLYVPVTYSAWAIIATLAEPAQPAAAGLDPAAFHAANLAVHLLATLLVYALLRRWFTLLPAALAALLFGLHPVQVEPVAWVSGFKDVLGGLLALAALWFDPLAQTPNSDCTPTPAARPGMVRYVAATALFALATLAKPSTLVLPLIVLTMAPARGIDLSAALRRLAPWFAIALACATWTKLVQARPIVDSPLWLRPLVTLHALGFYLLKLVAPLKLCVDYGRSPLWLRQHPAAWALGLLPLAVAAIAWRYRDRFRWSAIGAVVFAVGLLPMLGLVNFDFQFYSTVADHYLYLPMFGVALAAAAFAATLRPRTALTAGAVVLLALAARSWLQSRHWYDTNTLFAHALAVNPDSVAALNDAALRASAAGQAQSAEEYARRSLAVRPDAPNSIVTLATILAAQGRNDDAIQQYRLALSYDPNFGPALVNHGVALRQQGRLPEARKVLTRTVEATPDDFRAHLELGTVLSDLDQPKEAAAELEAAVRINPGDAQAHTNLGYVLMQLDKVAPAIKQFEAALQIDPTYPKAVDAMQRLRPARPTP